MIDCDTIIPSRTDVLSMAREAGFEELFKDSHDWVCFTEEIERFAALIASRVAAAAVEREREACAKVCDELADAYQKKNPTSSSEPLMRSCWNNAAAAIRARGETTSRGQA